MSEHDLDRVIAEQNVIATVRDYTNEALDNMTSMSIFFRVNSPCDACGSEKTEGGEFSCDMPVKDGSTYKAILCATCIAMALKKST